MKNKDWQILIIFDAMRWDIGSKTLQDKFEGDLYKVNTSVSTTFDWYKKYWSESTDVVLVSENPQPWHKNSNKAAQNFKGAYMSFGSNWLEVNPEKTLDLFFELYKQKPDDKYLVHLLPPHLPFYHGKGAELMSQLNLTGLTIYKAVQAWGKKNGFEKLQQYYTEQINAVSDLLLSKLHLLPVETKIVVSSDHGELIGFDGWQYDHPPNPNEAQAELLHNVPWFEIDLTETLVKTRLQAIGYLD